MQETAPVEGDVDADVVPAVEATEQVAGAPANSPRAVPDPRSNGAARQDQAAPGSVATAAPGMAVGPGPGDAERNACTAPQLRRFIKSRAYVPMHELRRRFAIEGDDDDVTPVDLERGNRVFVGLPFREGRLLGELLRAGDVGYELSLDPISPIVVGVFPMRPVPRA